ncbi:putative manganese transporter [Bowmanella denitrificans]|uniref:Manganese transporter n=1 Tax=Bowmanella denitrificans TaxID=366582 RepID=A0ABN0XFG4_9ALTE
MLRQGAKQFSQLTQLAPFWQARGWRILLLVALIINLLLPGPLAELIRQSLVDAYLGVSVFVLATLLLFYTIEQGLNVDLADLLRQNPLWQVPIATLLGVLPGCGGAVMVATAYSAGKISMGALVATLTATMGDAAFLLLFNQPVTALKVFALAAAAAIISGYLVDVLNLYVPARTRHSDVQVIAPRKATPFDYLYLLLGIPGLCFAIAGLLQWQPSVLLAQIQDSIALTALFLGMVIWCLSPATIHYNNKQSALLKAQDETLFVSSWVIGAFVLYAILDHFGGLNLAAVTGAGAVWMPMLGLLVGLLPGCGPQILLTTLYLHGQVPFSALLANAIGNDGDALFPTLAINGKAALWATLYSAVPALLFGYGWYWLVEA